MGACLSCQQVQLQPGKVHIKKIREIFSAYLKNQGVTSTQKSAGKDVIDKATELGIDAYVKTAAKDLLQLMQIDQQFIKKISSYLCKRILDYDQSTELQFLGLALLKEVMVAPLHERAKKEKNIVKKHL